MRRILLLALIGFVLGTPACLDLTGGCSNTVVSEINSPDNSRRVVVFQRDCGATTDFSTHISVLPASKPVTDDAGNVFTASGDTAQTNLGVRWLTADSLEVRHAPYGIFRKTSVINGVSVFYIAR